MSFNANKRQGRDSGGDKTYKRDTVLAIIVMAVLFISPVIITLTTDFSSNQSDIYESLMDEYADLLATSSNATASDAVEAEDDVTESAAADEENTAEADETDGAEETESTDAEESEAE